MATSLAYTVIINLGGQVRAVLATAFSHRFKCRLVPGDGSAVSNPIAVLVLGGLHLLSVPLNATTFVWAAEH